VKSAVNGFQAWIWEKRLSLAHPKVMEAAVMRFSSKWQERPLACMPTGTVSRRYHKQEILEFFRSEWQWVAAG